jgi:RNA polymerase sigma-70 factor (ECF subfamily)
MSASSSSPEANTGVARGDEGAFQRLFARLAPSVHGYFRRAVGSAAAADDLLQTTFLKLHRARLRWRAGEPVRPWLFGIAARVRADHLRRQASKGFMVADPDAGPEEEDQAEGPEDAAAGGERAARVRAALAALPETQRTVVELHRYHGLSFAEIAAALHTTEGAVKLRAFRAYEGLRAALGDLVGEGEP